MELVNLTPHSINILQKMMIEPSGTVARCKEITEDAGRVGSIPLIYRRYSDVEDLPAPKKDVFYIVSHMVRTALPERTDLLSPGSLLRDGDGNILGCTNFIINKLD